MVENTFNNGSVNLEHVQQAQELIFLSLEEAFRENGFDITKIAAAEKAIRTNASGDAYTHDAKIFLSDLIHKIAAEADKDQNRVLEVRELGELTSSILQDAERILYDSSSPDIVKLMAGDGLRGMAGEINEWANGNGIQPKDIIQVEAVRCAMTSALDVVDGGGFAQFSDDYISQPDRVSFGNLLYGDAQENETIFQAIFGNCAPIIYQGEATLQDLSSPTVSAVDNFNSLHGTLPKR